MIGKGDKRRPEDSKKFEDGFNRTFRKPRMILGGAVFCPICGKPMIKRYDRWFCGPLVVEV